MSELVIVYTTQDCVECDLVKQMFAKLGVFFENRDVSVNPQYQNEIEKLGYLGVPVTVVAGQAVKGYHPEELMKLLK